MSKAVPRLSQAIRPTRQEYDGRKLPSILKRLVGHVILAGFVAGGIALLFVRPWSILTCRHVEPGQTDCRLEKRVAWLIPVQRIPISGLQAAKVTQERTITGDDKEVVRYHVLLVSDAGETRLAAAADEWSSASQTTARRINDYVEAPSDEPLTIWGYGLWIHTLGTLCIGVFLLIFAFAFVLSLLNSLLLFGAWTLEGVLSVVGWGMDRAGFLPKARGQIPRLCQAVRAIVIQRSETDQACS